MRRSTTAIATTVVALGILTGCEGLGTRTTSEFASVTSDRTYQRTPVGLDTPGLGRGHELRRVTQNDNPYDLEGPVIHEEAIYEFANDLAKPGEFSSYMVLRDHHSRIPNRNAGELEITSWFIYIPTNVLDGEEAAHTLRLSMTGKYAQRSKLRKIDTSGMQTGTFKESHLDQPIDLETITFGRTPEGEPIEWYAPRVEDEAEGDGNLPFYMIRVDGTGYEINDDQSSPNFGQITLRSESPIMKPMKVLRSIYKLRTPTEQPAPDEDNPGQAVESPGN